MYKKIPEFQTLRTRLYAVFTGKIIQREPCAGGTRPRGSPHRTPSPKGAPQSGTQTRRPEVRTTRRQYISGARTDAACDAASGCAPPPGNTAAALRKASVSVSRQHLDRLPGQRRIRAAGRLPTPTVRTSAAKEKGVPGPRNADISPNTPPDANRAPRAGPPRGCAPWQRGARGQGSSR